MPFFLDTYSSKNRVSRAPLQIVDSLIMMAAPDTRLIGIIESVVGLNAVEFITGRHPQTLRVDVWRRRYEADMPHPPGEPLL